MSPLRLQRPALLLALALTAAGIILLVTHLHARWQARQAVAALFTDLPAFDSSHSKQALLDALLDQEESARLLIESLHRKKDSAHNPMDILRQIKQLEADLLPVRARISLLEAELHSSPE